MSQVGISRDYCALVGGPCSEALSATEELDAFIAYPDEAPIDHDMRMAKEAAEKRGYRVATWQDFAGESQIIFCKVCKAISSSQALWAEVTRASANVYFEIGYALALGKHLRLFCVPSKDPEKIPMIEDVLYFPYENVDELVNRALEETTESPLAERLQANAIEKRGGLHTLLMRRAYRMEAAQSIFKLLHRKLTPLQVNVKIDDPSELSGHDLFELTSLAANSRFVVVNMASSDRKRSRAENAGAALIAGYALGSSRRLLVLQEKPADPMLDLRGVRKEYSDAKEATQLLETWLDDVMPDVSSTADDHRQHRKRGAARIERWALNLGHPAAEYDPLLKECFTQNAAYNAAISGQRYLFVGRKGAGKTANCILLQSALEDGGTAVVRMIAPERMQLDGMIQEVANALDEIPDPAVLKAMWRHVLCTEIAATILREDADKPHPETAQAARRIADVLDTLAIRPDASFDTRLSECLQGLVDLHTSPHLTRPELLQAFHTREVAELLALLKTLELPIQVFLLIDNLDQDWRAEDTGLTAALINALVDEAQRLSHKELPGLAHIVVFLRTDIYEVARRQDPDADKKTPVHLRWDMESLFDLITQRLAAMLRTSGQVPPGEPEMIWHQVFEETVTSGEHTYEYIAQRTLLRPRELIQFCTRCIDLACQRGHGRVTGDDVVDCEADYSRDLYNNLKKEYAVGYPNLEAIGVELLGTHTRMSTREFAAVLQGAIRKDASLSNYSLDDLQAFCYDAGIMGICRGKRAVYSFEHAASREVLTMVQRAASRAGGKVTVEIHPGLHKCLELQSAD